MSSRQGPLTVSQRELSRIDCLVDVTAAAGTGETLRTAVTVILASAADSAAPETVIFGFPGGGYSRQYFDLQLAGNYSQAEYHAGKGLVFVGCDHVGVGDSDVPTQAIDFRAVARANSATARVVMARLTDGTFDESIEPLPIRTAIGVGQSFGGYLLTLAQAADPVFDGVAFLGWSGIENVVPWTQSVALGEAFHDGLGEGWDNPRRPTFFRDDVPRDIVERDMNRRVGRVGALEPWGTAYYPGGPAVQASETPLTRGAVSAEAATIAVPVFVAVGDVDIVPDLPGEASAYPASADVTLCRFSHMGHMHNFASSRHRLWARLNHWASIVADRSLRAQ